MSDDLAAFLLARIAEDEAAHPLTKFEIRWHDSGGHSHAFLDRAAANEFARRTDRPTSITEIPRDGSALAIAQRVRAECEAKRRIVELHKPWIEAYRGVYPDGSPGPFGRELHCEICGSNGVYTTDVSAACETLALLALPYADHPDYREEWRP